MFQKPEKVLNILTEEPNKNKQKNISPDMLWNSLGMVQQAIMFGILLIVYVFISLAINRHPGTHPGLESWLSALHGLFVTATLLKDIILGIILGIAAVVATSLLDVLVALVAREDLREWLHRTDHLLPVTSGQKRWALGISVLGSIQEEIMFRGFILIAIIPLWSHWIWAALILSAFFSLLHAGVQGFWSTVWIYMISVLLCVIIALGGSIYLAAITHVTINICNLFIVPAILNSKTNP